MPLIDFQKSGTRQKIVLTSVAMLALGLLAFFFVYPLVWDKLADSVNKKVNSGLSIPHFINVPFRLGLDLAGGTHLVYKADLSSVASSDAASSMEGIRDVIERRVNIFGVREPLIEVARSGGEWRLNVELAGIRDIGQAIQLIGETPYLDFREERPKDQTDAIIAKQKAGDKEALLEDPYFTLTNLNGKYLKKAQVTFDSTTSQPTVTLDFNDEGAKIFEKLTGRNVGKKLAIYLDGLPITEPTVQQAISGGQARITGNFTTDDAKKLAERLNAGALPVPISLISQESIGASLGQDSLNKSLVAGFIGFLAVALFMIIYYRLFGVLAVIALLVYTVLTLGLFKIIPVTLTLAGIAGFILSIGMAVDANILIFERLKEEIRTGKSLAFAIDDGFSRAWPSIRDSNVSTLITTVVLYTFTTSIIKGFALTLGIGVLVSMFSAIFLTRTFLKLFPISWLETIPWLLGLSAQAGVSGQKS